MCEHDDRGRTESWRQELCMWRTHPCYQFSHGRPSTYRRLPIAAFNEAIGGVITSSQESHYILFTR